MTKLNGKPVWWPDRRNPDGSVNLFLPDDPLDVDPQEMVRRQKEADRQFYQMANHPARAVRKQVQRQAHQDQTAQKHLARLRQILDD